MKRKATSPLIAEVILIFITVVVAVPLGGFLYDTMGNYAKSPDVSVNFVACTDGNTANTTNCSLNLNNMGTAPGILKPSSYLLIFYGHSTAAAYSSTCKGQTGDVIPPGSSLVVNCAFNISPGGAGARFTGWVALVTGQDLPFAGNF